MEHNGCDWKIGQGSFSLPMYFWSKFNSSVRRIARRLRERHSLRFGDTGYLTVETYRATASTVYTLRLEKRGDNVAQQVSGDMSSRADPHNTHTHKHEQVGLTPFPASIQHAQVFTSQTNGIPAVRNGLRSVDPDVLKVAGDTPDRRLYGDNRCCAKYINLIQIKE